MTTKNFFTAGYLSQQFQIGPATIEAELRLAGYNPELTFNGLAYWSADCATHLRHRVRHLQLAELKDFLRKED